MVSILWPRVMTRTTWSCPRPCAAGPRTGSAHGMGPSAPPGPSVLLTASPRVSPGFQGPPHPCRQHAWQALRPPSAEAGDCESAGQAPRVRPWASVPLGLMSSDVAAPGQEDPSPLTTSRARSGLPAQGGLWPFLSSPSTTPLGFCNRKGQGGPFGCPPRPQPLSFKG